MSINDTIEDWVDDVNRLDMKQPDEWQNVDEQLFTAQYSYIKLGLILTKIRNTTAWKYCAGKFESFKNWCQIKINLQVWQANQYIEASEIALYLIGTGAKVLPKNLSQCLALKKAYDAEESYYGERPQLDAAWNAVTNNYQPHQITAGKIHAIVDPDWESSQMTKIDKSIANRAWQQAKKRGMTMNEYLQNLLDEDEEQEIYSDDYLQQPGQTELNDEQKALIDRVEYQWLKPKTTKPTESIIEIGNNLIDRMDEFFNSMLKPKPA